MAEIEITARAADRPLYTTTSAKEREEVFDACLSLLSCSA
jgi:hypothetical protein